MTRRRAGGPLVAAVVFSVVLSGLAACASPRRSAGTPVSPLPSTPSSGAVPASPYPYPVASPGTGTAAALPPAQPPAVPSSSPVPSFADAVAVACAGYPGLAPIVALLRTQKVVSRSAAVSAVQGPLCAGAWQYTVLKVPGREPLQVVTEGTPEYLALIAAGTNVCTPMVRSEAPGGIVSLAHC